MARSLDVVNDGSPRTDGTDAVEVREAFDRTLGGRRLVIQIIGFALGATLIAWCVHGAVTGADWTKLRDAPPLALLALVGCGVVSAVVNGLIFWLTLRPVRRLSIIELQGVNFVASLLNYAPVRLGTVFRIAWHRRVDRLAWPTLGAWFALLGFGVLACAGAATVTTLLFGRIDLLWGATTIALVAAAGFALQRVAALPAIQRRAAGLDRFANDPRVVFGMLGLRLLDLAAWTGRMAIAAWILDLGLDAGEVTLLALAAVILSFNPLGRFGFREATVAIVASQLGGANEGDVDAAFQQLALVESAGEALPVLPLGALSIAMLWRRWRRGG